MLHDKAILGVDLLPGESPQAGGETRYAAVLLVNGEVRKRYPSITFSEIISLIKREHVEVLAVDNVLELASSWRELVDRLSQIPWTVKLIQVTAYDGKLYKLETLARAFGLFQGKPSPLESAETISKLALMGIGSEIPLFENETRVIIARGRSPTQGGMSKERYRRNVELLILRAAREIKEKLDKNGIDYDFYKRKGEYGLEGCVFIVYADRSKLKGIIRPRRGHDYHIEIKPIYRARPEYIPLFKKKTSPRTAKRYLIVGVDPGISTGLAILSLAGHPLLVMSRRWLSRREIVRIVAEYGQAVVVSSDTNPPSPFVRKLASSLNAALFTPTRSLSIDEKREMVQEFTKKYPETVKVKDSHQRDALAAALKAFNHFKPKFDQVDSKLKDLDTKIPSDEVKALVIRGISIADAVAKVLNKYLNIQREITLEAKSGEDIDSYKRKVQELEIRIASLEAERQKLLEEIDELKHALKEKEEAIEHLLSAQSYAIKLDRTVENLSRRIRLLEEENAKLKEEVEKLSLDLKNWIELALQAAQGNYICCSVIKGIHSKYLNTDIHGRPVFIENPNVYEKLAAERLAEIRPEAIVVTVCPDAIKEFFEERRIPVIVMDSSRAIQVGSLALVHRETYDHLFRREMEAIRQRDEHKNLEEKIKGIILEYRASRIKKLKTGVKRLE